MMITGETVIIERETLTNELDPFGSYLTATTYQTVDNVLVSPGSRSDADGQIRPEGVIVEWVLHFPKTFADSLRGARVSVRSEPSLAVVGDPKPYTADNTPGQWWMPVELSRVDG